MKTQVSATFFILILVVHYTFTPIPKCAARDSVTYKPAVFTDPNRAEKVLSTAAAVDNIFKQFGENRHMPGLVYGVVLDGKLIYSGSFGYANLERQITADSHSLFRIASMSKSFTAMAILQLRDAGKLNLDDPVSKYIPEMKEITYPTTDSPEITIRHLLTHGAGFPEDNPWGDRQLADTDEELLRIIREGITFSNVPGVTYEYSNLGFAILGQVVQRVSGMDFREYTRKNIFQPLGMNATVWEYENAPENILAHGYNRVDDSFVNIPLEHHGAFGAMGGLITTIDDFTKYVALHLSAWPPRSGADTGPLKRSSLREMHHPWRFIQLNAGFHYPDGRECPVVSAYAYGLHWMKDCNGRVYIGHSGGLPGFGSNWTMMPGYGLAVMSFDNRTYGSTSGINIAVLDTIIKMAGLKPRTLPASDILKKRKNELVKILPDWEGAESSGLFAGNFFLDNRLQDLVKHSKTLFRETGRIISIGPMKPLNQLRGTFIIEGEKKNIEVFFTLTPEKEPRIQQVRMSAVKKMQ
ncbi:MAG: beta-lactamase family protein [Chlorobi bacterium]|nr:beta-lactamase family protein [Chlorobiota bacterium]